jgi:hypothetical protein
MPLEQLLPYVPVLAIVAGVVLVLWNERARIVSAIRAHRPTVNTESGLTPAERFDRFYALRNWCEQASAAEAVKALDGVVLPAIVKGGDPS